MPPPLTAFKFMAFWFFFIAAIVLLVVGHPPLITAQVCALIAIAAALAPTLRW